MTDRPVTWIDAFVDVPVAKAPAFRAFWSAVTGGPISSARGDRGQFRSVLPPVGRAYLRVQELEGPTRVHLDLLSPDLRADRARLVALGAMPVQSLPDVEILRSPAGQVHCLVRDDEVRPPDAPARWATAWPDGHRSRLLQVCLDTPADRYDDEVAYWRAATGWASWDSDLPEFTHLGAPAGAPIKLLLQRLSRTDDVQGAHLDLGTDDVGAEVLRLVELGAIDLGPGEGWHVLADPVAGLAVLRDRSAAVIEPSPHP